MKLVDLFRKKKSDNVITAPTVPIKIIGIYRVPDVSDCFYFEMEFGVAPNDIDISKITQKFPKAKKGDEQVPYDEKYLDDDGVAVIGDFMNKPVGKNSTRVGFFFFCFDFGVPLSTQFGDVPLCKVSEIPDRLKGIVSFDKEMFD